MKKINKIPHNVKGIIKVAPFCTLNCKKGQIHEDKVMFDQVNSTAMGGVAYLGSQRNVNEEEDIWWRKP